MSIAPYFGGSVGEDIGDDNLEVRKKQVATNKKYLKKRKKEKKKRKTTPV
jgi:hypothetical protein